MADSKITELTANTTPITTDILPIVDDPGGTPVTQKVTIASLQTVFAAAEKGVTNGDSHDHNGGDGAAIVKAAITLADNTTNDVSTTKHGLVPKAPSDSTKFLRGDATWAVPSASVAWGAITGTLSAQTDLQGALDGKAASLGADDNYVTDAEKVKLTNLTGVNSGDQTLPTDATIVTTDVTTNNVSITKHGWAPKAPNTTHQWLRGDGTWASHKMLVATLAGDQATGANVTPVTLSGLVFTYEANSVYKINLYALVSPTASTTGCGFQFDLSSAVTRVALMFYHQLANTGTLSGGHSVADDASVGVSSGMPANGGVYPVHGEGILVTGGNTGTAQLRFRSETTAVTTCKNGTVLVVEKIA